MSRKYGKIVQVIATDQNQPAGFIWRGSTYHVQEILAAWHLRDRWWGMTSPASPGAQETKPSDRYYYRLQCDPELFQCELYYDATSMCWVLDRVYD